jgi:hypothetical protein
MPNWCHDELTVSGDPDKVAAFVEKVRIGDKPLTFTVHVPEPELEGEAWYGWRVDHWGTKWDAKTDSTLMAIGSEAAIDALDAATTSLAWVPTDGGMQIKFQTAWTSPLQWLLAASEQEPELRFVLRYAEPGMGFAGEARVHAGNVHHQDLEVGEVLSEEEMWF